MGRNARQNKIIELIREKDIERQEDLVSELIKEGYKVTQATVSRDIKDLNIIKTVVDGKQKYVKEQATANVSSQLEEMIRHAVLSTDHAANIAVVKTIQGSANVVALLIDNMNDKDILGTIAGDDTLAIIARDEQAAIRICGIISSIATD